jgi:hypothetical protein
MMIDAIVATSARMPKRKARTQREDSIRIGGLCGFHELLSSVGTTTKAASYWLTLLAVSQPGASSVS